MTKKIVAHPQARTGARPKRRARPSTLQRLRRRDIILLAGLVMLACSSLITVGLLILRYQSGPAVAGGSEAARPDPIHTVAHTEITGLSQYRLAQQAGQAWAADAQLVSASASWPEVVALDQVGAPAEWNYRFYSPGQERLLIVKVGADAGVSEVEHGVRITLPPVPLSPDNWLIDSPTALATWLDYGGADLVRRNPGLEVLIQLRTIKDHDGPVWMVIGLDRRTQDLHVVVVDAAGGQVIQPERQF